MMLRVCAVALLTVIVGTVLSELGFKGKKLISILAILIMLTMIGDGITALVDKLTAFSELTGIGDAARSALKVVGIGYLFGFTSDVCRELGEVGVASAVGIVGRVEAFLAVLPYFEKTLEMGVGLLE